MNGCRGPHICSPCPQKGSKQFNYVMTVWLLLFRFFLEWNYWNGQAGSIALVGSVDFPSSLDLLELPRDLFFQLGLAFCRNS